MKRLLKVFGLTLGGGIFVIIVFAASKDNQYRVEESIVTRASPEKVFAEISDLRRWEAWSPWRQKDPSISSIYDGATGVGSSMTWTSQKNGSGKIKITESVPGQRIRYHLIFREIRAQSEGEILLTPESEGTKVTWIMEGFHPYIEKVLWIVLRLERSIQKDFELGLSLLKTKVDN